MITFCTWFWGDKYSPDYVTKLSEGIRRNMREPFRFRIFEPEDQDMHLTKIPGCFARLRMFDVEWQKRNKIEDKLVCMDLDMIITGKLDSLFSGNDKFKIFQQANSANPCPYNGSLMMLQPGAHPEIWNDFSLEAIKMIDRYEFPDDQGWIHHKVKDAAGWICGKQSGVYACGKREWPKSNQLPEGARIVAFPGKRDPSQFTNLEWVNEHWRL